ncbi:MAG: peptidase M14, partial [Bacteroidota bacterium]
VEDTLSYSYEERPLARGAQFIGGTILNVELDETHPLAFGYGASVPVFRRNTLAFGDSVESSTVVGTYAASPVLSGYASGEQEQRLASTPALVAEPNGAGEVILMPDNPSFRAFWYGTDGLLMNAILMPF